MKPKHLFIVLLSFGFGLGAIMGTVITAVSATLSAGDGALHVCSDEFIAAVGNPLAAFIIQVLACSVYGMIPMGGAVVYSIEKWSIARCTLTHYIPTMVCFFGLGFLMRWFSLENPAELLIMFVSMTVGYFFIWLCNYISYKIKLKKINEDLKQLNSPKAS